MLFEMWLAGQGYDIKKLSKKEGRALYEKFKLKMLPAVRDCSKMLNAAMEAAQSKPLEESSGSVSERK